MYKFLFEYVFSIFLDVYLGGALLGHMVTLFKFLSKLPDCFPKQLHHFTFLPVMYEGSSFSTSSPTLNFLGFDSSHRNGCEEVSLYGFDLHFPNDE